MWCWRYCQIVVKRWQLRESGQERRSGCGQVFREMEQLISSLQSFKFVFLRREANKVAHVCAKHSLSLAFAVVSFELIPEFLNKLGLSAERLSSSE